MTEREIIVGCSYTAQDGSYWMDATRFDVDFWRLHNLQGENMVFNDAGVAKGSLGFLPSPKNLKLETAHYRCGPLEVMHDEDPRITDEVVRMASIAGLKADPNLHEFTRSILRAGLKQIDGQEADRRSDVARLQADLDAALAFIAKDAGSLQRLRKNHPDLAYMAGLVGRPGNESVQTVLPSAKSEVQSGGLAHQIITTIVVQAFENDEQIEQLLRAYERPIAALIDHARTRFAG